LPEPSRISIFASGPFLPGRPGSLSAHPRGWGRRWRLLLPLFLFALALLLLVGRGQAGDVQRIGDQRAIGSGLAAELSGAREARRPGLGHLVLRRIRDLEQMQRLLLGRLRERPQRADVVHDIEAAAMGGDDQVVLPGVDRQVHDRDGRHAVGPLHPVLAPVERHPKAELGT
jgi:hypothetical protein